MHSTPSGAHATIPRMAFGAVLESDEERQIIHEARSGVVLVRYEGLISMRLWERTRAIFEAAVARAGSIIAITDAEMCTGSVPELGKAWTAMCIAIGERMTGRYVLAKSAFMRMSVQTTAMDSAFAVNMYRERRDFLEDVLERVPGLDLSAFAPRNASRG